MPRKATPKGRGRDTSDARLSTAQRRSEYMRRALIAKRRSAPPVRPPTDTGEPVTDVRMMNTAEVADAITRAVPGMLTAMLKVADSVATSNEMVPMVCELVDRLLDGGDVVMALCSLAALGYDKIIWEVASPERLPALFKDDAGAARFLLRVLLEQCRTELINSVAACPSYLDAMNVDDENGMLGLMHVSSTPFGAQAIARIEYGVTKPLSIYKESPAALALIINLIHHGPTEVLMKVAKSGMLRELSEILETMPYNMDDGEEWEMTLLLIGVIETFYEAAITAPSITMDYLEVLRDSVSPEALASRPALREKIAGNPLLDEVNTNGWCTLDTSSPMSICLPPDTRMFRYGGRQAVLLHEDGGIVAWVETLLETAGAVMVESRDFRFDKDSAALAHLPVRLFRHGGKTLLLRVDGGLVEYISGLLDDCDGGVTVESPDFVDADLDAMADANLPILETDEKDWVKRVWFAE